MLNLAGREYDFGPVLFAVLQECEHRRRGLPAEPESAGAAAAKLEELTRAKLAEIRACYEEAGGSPGYWRELESEVLDTALPQYARAAAAQTRLELASYGLWRQGDPVSRLVLGLGGLVAGGLIVKAPFIPIFEDTFAFALAVAAFLYPEIKRLVFDWRYSRLLNRLIVQAERYQHRQLPYVSEAGLEAELRAVGVNPNATTTLPPARQAATATQSAASLAATQSAAGQAAAATATRPLRPPRSAKSPLSIFAPSATAGRPEAEPSQSHHAPASPPTVPAVPAAGADPQKAGSRR
jgi:hypothetical protein